MLLEILWSLEGFSAELALVGLERNVDSDVGGDVVSLDRRGSALAPGAGEIEVVCRLTANMTFADMFLYVC